MVTSFLNYSLVPIGGMWDFLVTYTDTALLEKLEELELELDRLEDEEDDWLEDELLEDEDDLLEEDEDEEEISNSVFSTLKLICPVDTSNES